MARPQLLAKFPEHGGLIEAIPDVAEMQDGTSVDEVVEVVEAWYLPSSKGAGDGRHVICVDNLTLEDEEWTMDEFPFVFWKWGMTPIGFWGTGVMEELGGIQDELNKLLERVQESMHVCATTWVMTPVSANIEPDDLGNLPGRQVPWEGHLEPKVYAPPSMNAQVFDHIWKLRDAAYEVVGISQMSAASIKPPGLESGRALRTLQDTETQRFMLLADRWQEWVVSVVERAMDFGREIYGKRSIKVKWGEGTLVEEIDWKDVNMEQDSYVLRLYPVNYLPTTPAGKMERIEELARLGVFSPEEIKSLMDFPDLAKVMDMNTAAYEDSVMIMDGILYKGEEWHPQEEMHLELTIKMAQHYWCLGHKDGAPESRLNLLVTWMREARQLVQRKAAAEQAMAQAMAPAGMEPGMGGPPMPGAEGMPPDAMLAESFQPEGPAAIAPAGGGPLGGLPQQ
jgi:hypothetical protein